MKLLQEIYDQAIAEKHWVYFNWYLNYKKWVPQFINEAKTKVSWADWDKEVFNQYLPETKNCVSSLQQKNFSNQDVEKIKSIWPQLSPLLKKLAIEQLYDKETYNLIRSIIRSQTKEDMRSATNRLIAGLQPGILTTIIKHDKFNFVLRELKSIFKNEFFHISWDWNEDNNSFINYCKENVNFIEEWHSSLFAWLLHDYFEDENDKRNAKKLIMNNKIDLLINNKNIILTGAPGTGKTFLAKKMAKLITGNDTDENNKQYGFVQFHPSFDYTDFVEGLRPKKVEGKDLGFELNDGIFMDFCKEAMKEENKDKKFVFVIDEINRGEISKIFGELFFSLDPGYRGSDGKVKTQYANLREPKDQYFYVPKNVYIIGTMNDIDRSVESFDFAMRRRFTWLEITADERISMWDDIEKGIPNWKETAKKKMQNLNTKIEKIQGLSKAYHIGPAYFLKLRGYNGDFQKLWENHLYPLLKEYLRGMPESDKKIIELKSAYDNE